MDDFHLPTVLLSSDPFRPPGWRWHRASDVVANDRRVLPRHDDGEVRRAVAYLRCLSRGAPAARLARRWPELHAALEIYETDSVRRWELEALLLTTEPFDTVAARCGIRNDAVETYHDTFFHVRDRLGAAAYICGVAIGERMYVGLTADDWPVLAKVFAYRGGVPALDAVLRLRREGPPAAPRNFRHLDDAALRELHERLAFRAAVLGLSVPVSASTAPGLLRLSLDARLQEVKEASRTAVSAAIKTDGVAAYLGAGASIPTAPTCLPFPGFSGEALPPAAGVAGGMPRAQAAG